MKYTEIEEQLRVSLGFVCWRSERNIPPLVVLQVDSVFVDVSFKKMRKLLCRSCNYHHESRVAVHQEWLKLMQKAKI